MAEVKGRLVCLFEREHKVVFCSRPKNYSSKENSFTLCRERADLNITLDEEVTCMACMHCEKNLERREIREKGISLLAYRTFSSQNHFAS